MSEWKEYKLGDIADVQTGPFGSQLHMSDYKISGTPIITVEHLGENRIVHKNLPLVGKDDKQRLIKYTLKEGDIVFSRVGSVDRRAYVSDKEDGWMFSGRCLRVRVNKEKVDPKFLSFYFGQENFKEMIRRIAVGATMPSINTTILSDIEISIPKLSVQKAIETILSNLDDKIDLLSRQNKTLEQLAETLFRQWFVEEAEENWEEKRLSELLDFVVDNRGKTAPTADEGIPLIATNCIKNGNIFPVYEKVRYISEETYSNWFRAHPKPGDIIFVNKGTPGCVNLVPDPIDFCIAQDMIALRVNKNITSNYFLFLYFRSGAIQSQIENSSVGTTIPHLKKTDLLRFIITIPDISIINEFDEIVEPLFNQMNKNYLQIRTLTQTRDTLLPKLMSGEVRVKM